MSIKIFVHYNDNGDILSQTFEDEIFFNNRIQNGENVIEVEHQFDFKQFKVDMKTMQIVKKEDRK